MQAGYQAARAGQKQSEHGARRVSLGFRAKPEGQEYERIHGSAEHARRRRAPSPIGHGPKRDIASESDACELINRRWPYKEPKKSIFQQLEQAKEQGREHQELSKSDKV